MNHIVERLKISLAKKETKIGLAVVGGVFVVGSIYFIETNSAPKEKEQSKNSEDIIIPTVDSSKEFKSKEEAYLSQADNQNMNDESFFEGYSLEKEPSTKKGEFNLAEDLTTKPKTNTQQTYRPVTGFQSYNPSKPSQSYSSGTGTYSSSGAYMLNPETPTSKPQAVATTQPVQPQPPEEKVRTRNMAGYYGNMTKPKTTTSKLVTAVIHNSNREITNGSTVKVRITQPMTVNGISLPENAYMSGVTSFQSERLTIDINSITYNGEIIDCKFTVYDLDGIRGIYVPGLTNRDITNEQIDQSLSKKGISINTPLGSINTGGIKKKKDKIVTVKDGYEISIRQL